MPSFSSYSALGTSIETAEIGNGEVTFEKLDDVNAWKLLDTLTYSNESSKTTDTLDAYDEYLILCSWQNVLSARQIGLRINGDTGNNYTAIYYDDVTPTKAVTSNSPMCRTSTTTDSFCALSIQGKTPAVSSGVLTGYYIGSMGSVASGRYHGISVAWSGGNDVQITDFTIFSGDGNFSGTVKIYGRNL
jgi:hypothetical protein